VAAIPPRIRPGQTIGVCAPAGPVKLDRLARGLDKLAGTFELRVTPGVTANREPGVPSYLAASDEQRAAELQGLIDDPDVRAIVLARGGYGLMRILPRLDPAPLVRDPKPIVGFSDATALLAWAHAAGVRGIHGPMIAQLGDLPDADTARLIEVLTDPHAHGERPWSLSAHGRGVHRGPLAPVNLTMLSVLAGTPWPVPTDGSIVLIEEVGERPYEIDRYLTHLRLAGVLDQLAGAVIADLTRCVDNAPPSGDPDPPDAALQTVLERLAPLPIAVGAPIGHGTRNEAVPFGAACELDLDRGVVTIVDAAVR